jgi:proliferating cell nuclear antigen
MAAPTANVPIPNLRECSFLMHTVQSHALRCTIESLKDVLLDVSVHISPDGMKICTLDYSKTAIVYLKIDASKCETFHCEKEMSIGISVTSLFKLVKTISMNDLITLFIRASTPETLQIIIDCRDRFLFFLPSVFPQVVNPLKTGA